MFPLIGLGRIVANRKLAAGLAVILACLVLQGPVRTLAQEEKPPQREVNTAVQGFLHMVNVSNEEKLRSTAGLSKEVVDRIIGYRASGHSFQNIREFRRITRITSADFQQALQPFIDKQARSNAVSARPPVPDPDRKRAMMQRKAAANAPRVEDSKETKGLNLTVRPGFYGHLPGYQDWEGIDPLARKEFFETVNRELCTCGCANETLAFCLVNDPGCPVVKARVKKIYDDIVKRTKPAESK